MLRSIKRRKYWNTVKTKYSILEYCKFEISVPNALQTNRTMVFNTYRLWDSRSGIFFIFKHSMGARNRVGIGLSYRPARLHRLAELMPWNPGLLKGSLTRDFRLQVFFMNQCPPGPQVFHCGCLNFFENSRRYSRMNIYRRCQ
jgi:hypothetical protein